MKTYHPFSSEVALDPYPYYSWLREEDPLHYVEDLDFYVVSRYEDVHAILKNPALFSSQAGMGLLMGSGAPGKLREFMRARNPGGFGALGYDALSSMRTLISADPPDHTRLRRLVNKPFTPKAMTSLAPRIRQICEGLVDDLILANEEGKADLIEHLAYPLPVIVIAEMLGIPAERRAEFKLWSDDVVGVLSGGVRDVEKMAQGSLKMFMYFSEVLEERRQAPSEDLISLLVRSSEEGDYLKTEEVIMFCVLLLIAGNETTTNLIANGAQALFARPELWRELRKTPSLLPAAVEEVLRFDAPVQGLFRATTSEVELHGKKLRAGVPLMVLFGSANRDPRHYPEPEAFHLDRNATDHLAFGAGIHLCLGAPLARLEAKIAGEVLLERTRKMQPNGEPTRIDSFLLRGLSRMPVRFEPALP
ncbi:cytochrome P450 [Haliangium sp. UPWRP_2]|uniref:cytochrome P450 n=1 Tax=Haliangium sp. UPWRP_2 TaxID=1931276 RepID=UPI000B544A6D|nr:cytochrome P450 [Haliangium sp. UPWRP_2]PSM32093.1 cytochrome P450 [Haliangium sp. UPWRP_2]